MRASLLAAVVVLMSALDAAPVLAQTAEPGYETLVSRFQSDPLRLGLLLQVVADFQSERSENGTNGFSVANMRLAVSGRLDAGFHYLLQANFINSPAILDARVGFESAPAFRVDAGRFKVPFSYEFLTSAASIDFVNRARVVSALAPNRQLGVQASGRVSSGVRYAAGVFSGPRSENPSGFVLGAGRLSVRTGDDRDEGVVDAGLNLAAGRNGTIDGRDDVEIATDARLLVGADVRYERRALLLAGELIAGRLTFDDAAPTEEPWGFHATAGWRPTRRTQLLLRWDHFAPDVDDASQRVVLGFNAWPTTPTEVQVNWVVPVDGALANHQLLVNFQVGF